MHLQLTDRDSACLSITMTFDAGWEADVAPAGADAGIEAEGEKRLRHRRCRGQNQNAW